MSGMDITSKDIIEILAASAGTKIKKIRLGGLLLEFDTEKHPDKNLSYAEHMEVESKGVQGWPPDPEHSQTSEPMMSDNELMLNEMADLLSIEDPAAFEELQLKILKQGQQ